MATSLEWPVQGNLGLTFHPICSNSDFQSIQFRCFWIAKIQSFSSPLAHGSVQNKSVCAEFYTGCNTQIWWGKVADPRQISLKIEHSMETALEPDKCVPISPRPNPALLATRSRSTGKKSVSVLWQLHKFYFSLAEICRIHMNPCLFECSFVFYYLHYD